MTTENLGLIAAAEWMLRNGWDLFSKKQVPETGDWWVLIYRPREPGDATVRVRGEGATLDEALDSALKFAGIGGVSWSLSKLDVRVRALREFLGDKDSRPPSKTCPHKVSGGRCKECG